MLTDKQTDDFEERKSIMLESEVPLEEVDSLALADVLEGSVLEINGQTELDFS